MGPTIRGVATAALLCGVLACCAVPAFGDTIDFTAQVRPILNNHCLHCHGPDPGSRQANLRLDLPEEAFAERRTGTPIVPGDPAASMVIDRIATTDPNLVMPPPDHDHPLEPEQVAVIRQWIAEGADWPEHWAFSKPERPEMPEPAAAADWVRNPIDAFVLARLEREGLAPSAEADPATLLRRLHLDLTGLPPTPEDLRRFLAVPLEAAYGQAVNRLLASPHYGEHWAREWLDAAQYADSDGFEKDKPRMVWAWRDWVINAFNENKPYDTFIREQIAGDLMPGATRDQVVATGFLRNSLLNEEGGVDPEQFRVEGIFNRVDVVGSSVLGLTMQCAQCHTHKFDPISHTEYFQFFSYFNNSYEANVTVLSDAEQRQADEVLARIAAVEDRIREIHPEWEERMAAWEADIRARPAPEWHPVSLEFDDTASGGQKFLPRDDGGYLGQGYSPNSSAPKMAGPSPLERITAFRLDLLTDGNLPRGGPGRSVHGTAALSTVEFRIGPEDGPFDAFDNWERVPVASGIADVNPPRRPLGPEFPQRGDRKPFTGSIQMALDDHRDTAWTIDIGPGRSNRDRYAIFTLAEPLEVPPGHKLAFRLGQNHGGWNDNDSQNNSLGGFRLSVTDADILPEEAVPVEIEAIVRRGPEHRTPEEHRQVFSHWRTVEPGLGLANLEIELIWADYPAGTTQLVYRDRDTPRVTRLFERGDFLSPAEAVEPGVPAFLHPLPEDATPDRLGLARWITDPESPTTARVYVNRVWQRYFGRGLVETANDFGTQAPPPSHPELLDWLATAFVESGWDVKALHRLIVESATYRQEAVLTEELRERDPDNFLLARGARFRVEGETVRDIALAASGLLHPTVGGPSIYPPAPPEIFEPPASYGHKYWPVSQGEDQYRRGIYVFRFRSVPHPTLQVFDTPPGEAPCTGRQRSNTPLQSLVTLNEPMFLEAARALALETLREGGTSDAERIAYAFRRCATRTPDAEETAVLAAFLAEQRARLAAGALPSAELLALDETTGDTIAEPEEWAAWTLVARVLLNLDETITRP